MRNINLTIALFSTIVCGGSAFAAVSCKLGIKEASEILKEVTFQVQFDQDGHVIAGDLEAERADLQDKARMRNNAFEVLQSLPPKTCSVDDSMAKIGLYTEIEQLGQKIALIEKGLAQLDSALVLHSTVTKLEASHQAALVVFSKKEELTWTDYARSSLPYMITGIALGALIYRVYTLQGTMRDIRNFKVTYHPMGASCFTQAPSDLIGGFVKKPDGSWGTFKNQ